MVMTEMLSPLFLKDHGHRGISKIPFMTLKIPNGCGPLHLTLLSTLNRLGIRYFRTIFFRVYYLLV